MHRCFAAVNLQNEHDEKILKLAHNSAEITFENDVLYRRWGRATGRGVCFPSRSTRPRIHTFVVPDRDVTTSSGLSLTLVNPAYMARQVNQMAVGVNGSRGRITSLKPIRPENRPDAWEAAALASFETGTKAATSVET